MVSEIAIVGFALALFFYWFRHNCRSILRSKSSPDRVRQVAAANQLSFPAIYEQLQGAASARQLDTLNESLQRDYRVLTCLLRYTAGFKAGSYTVEQRVLLLDFRLMQLWYALTRKLILPQAKRSLEERSHILHYLAASMGERCAAISHA